MSDGRSLVVVGAGGHAKVVVAAAQERGWRVVALVDDDPATWGREVLGVAVVGDMDALVGRDFDGAVIGIGGNQTRRALAERLDLPWATIVHPQSWVHTSVTLGVGTVVFAGSVVQPGTLIGRHAILNTGATVDHDSRVGDYAHLAPGTNLAGGVTVEEGAFLGIGSCVIPGVSIGAWAVVGAGAAVVRSVPGGVIAAGVPARVLGPIAQVEGVAG